MPFCLLVSLKKNGACLILTIKEDCRPAICSVFTEHNHMPGICKTAMCPQRAFSTEKTVIQPLQCCHGDPQGAGDSSGEGYRYPTRGKDWREGLQALLGGKEHTAADGKEHGGTALQRASYITFWRLNFLPKVLGSQEGP